MNRKNRKSMFQEMGEGIIVKSTIKTSIKKLSNEAKRDHLKSKQRIRVKRVIRCTHPCCNGSLRNHRLIEVLESKEYNESEKQTTNKPFIDVLEIKSTTNRKSKQRINPSSMFRK